MQAVRRGFPRFLPCVSLTNVRLLYFFFQAEDGIRDPLWSRGLGDVYKRQTLDSISVQTPFFWRYVEHLGLSFERFTVQAVRRVFPRLLPCVSLTNVLLL